MDFGFDNSAFAKKKGLYLMLLNFSCRIEEARWAVFASSLY